MSHDKRILGHGTMGTIALLALIVTMVLCALLVHWTRNRSGIVSKKTFTFEADIDDSKLVFADDTIEEKMAEYFESITGNHPVLVLVEAEIDGDFYGAYTVTHQGVHYSSWGGPSNHGAFNHNDIYTTENTDFSGVDTALGNVGDQADVPFRVTFVELSNDFEAEHLLDKLRKMFRHFGKDFLPETMFTELRYDLHYHQTGGLALYGALPQRESS